MSVFEWKILQLTNARLSLYCHVLLTHNSSVAMVDWILGRQNLVASLSQHVGSQPEGRNQLIVCEQVGHDSRNISCQRSAIILVDPIQFTAVPYSVYYY